MIFERIKAEGLAQNSYFVGSQSAAAVIDPIRDIDWYLNLAIKYGTKIKYVFETHRNEDFVIGSVELAAATGAEIYHGSWMDFKYGNPLQDGQEFNIGKLNVTAIHTPGHTDESMSFVLKEKSAGQMPVMVFTGDALFVNDTGRVDFGGIGDIPRMASNLFDSLFNRLLTLGDGTIICPAHGAGSVCGSNIAERDESTIGIEKQNNPALKLTLKDNFIRYKAAEKHEKPTYFSMMEKYNLEGPPLLNKLPLVSPLGHTAFKKALEESYQVIDTRSPAAFGAHIKGTYHIWLAGVPSYAGWYLDYRKPILLILEDDNQLDKPCVI
jgi:hydroxyacylglutathione hydrolase